VTTQNPTSPSTKDGLKESLIEFPDNRLLIDLCGAYDQHLAAIEKALDVQIIRRGNQLAILGSAAGLDEVTEILKALYQRLEAGRTIEPGDIDRELRMQGDGENGVDRKVDQLEMFSGEKFEIKTRKKLLSRVRMRKKPMSLHCSQMNWPLELALLARERPIWRLPLGSQCSLPAKLIRLFCLVRRSKQAKSWAIFLGI